MKSFLEFLRDRINAKDWNLWFSSLKVDKVDKDKTVHLVVGNLFVREWLLKKYGNIIKKAVEIYYGQDYKFTLDFETVDNGDAKISGPLVRKKPLILSTLNPDFTFENFIVGEENRMIYSASIEVANNPGLYNPFVITGGVGLGKTHLMQAIGRRIQEMDPDVKVLYVTSETFMNEMIEAIKSETMTKFREKLRKKLDVLLLDDIQFLIDKNWLQNELFHTMNELMNAGKQIVVCSDREVRDLKGFHDRLISRFQMGLNLSIKPPSYTTRKKIIMMFSKRCSVSLDEEMVDYIARNISGNVRRLKGAVLRLSMYQETEGKINLTTMVDLIQDLLDPPSTQKNTENLIERISKILGVNPSLLLSNSRKKNLTLLRMISIFFCVRYLNIPINDVARMFSRSRTTVLYILKKLDATKSNLPIRSLLTKLEESFAGEMGKSVG